MPESHKAERRRVQKSNRAAGIGDEDGRIPVRVKDPGTLLKCLICLSEFKVTKTNTELKAHALGKHGKAAYEEVFPGAEGKMKDLLASMTVKGGKSSGGAAKGGPTKAEQKKMAANGMDDLLSAGLSTGKKKKGKK